MPISNQDVKATIPIWNSRSRSISRDENFSRNRGGFSDPKGLVQRRKVEKFIMEGPRLKRRMIRDV